MSSKLHKTLAFIIACSIAIACKKDNPQPENELTYNGQTITLASASYVITNDYESLEVYSEGQQYMVNIILSKIGDDVAQGTYTYANRNNNPNYNPWENFWYGHIVVPDEPVDEVVSGSVSIRKTGSTYQIAFDLVTEKSTINGRYLGPVTVSP